MGTGISYYFEVKGLQEEDIPRIQKVFNETATKLMDKFQGAVKVPSAVQGISPPKYVVPIKAFSTIFTGPTKRFVEARIEDFFPLLEEALGKKVIPIPTGVSFGFTPDPKVYN